ncbi:MAG: permease [Mycobacterium sp.]|nr:permease [Mycobacterium sp.]
MVVSGPSVLSKREASRSVNGAHRRAGTLELLIGLLVVAFAGQRWFAHVFDHPAVLAWTTVFVAVVVQAVPFLILGVLVSGALAVFIPATFFVRVLPRRSLVAVPVAGLAGAVLPGCECASVPVARRLIGRGVPPATALTFLLAAPAINPVVLVATAVAFPGRPQVVAARFAASLLAAVVIGWVWTRIGRRAWLSDSHATEHEHAGLFTIAVRHDFLQAGGFLVIGAITSATLNTAVPRSAVNSVADRGWLAILGLAVLAVVLAVCSEADAFIASSLTQFSLTARLAFMVIGPMVDIKLVVMQAGTFGRQFVIRFAPLVFLVGIGASVLIGAWLL